MERIGENGERREVRPEEIAQVDQIMARQEEISHRLTFLFTKIKEAAEADEPRTVGALTAQLRDLLYRYFPGAREANREVFDFIMYLIGLLASASEAQKQAYETAEAMLHGIITLLPAGHPMHSLDYFQEEAVLKRIGTNLHRDLPEELIKRLTLNPPKSTYRCGDGVVLENVHLEDECLGTFCAIHRPAPGPWDTWPTSWMPGLHAMGRTCPHGVVHMSIEDLLQDPVGLTTVHDHEGTGCDCPCDMSRVEMILSDDSQQVIGFRPITG